jgi:hypothetical protein
MHQRRVGEMSRPSVGASLISTSSIWCHTLHDWCEMVNLDRMQVFCCGRDKKKLYLWLNSIKNTAHHTRSVGLATLSTGGEVWWRHDWHNVAFLICLNLLSRPNIPRSRLLLVWGWMTRAIRRKRWAWQPQTRPLVQRHVEDKSANSYDTVAFNHNINFQLYYEIVST